MAPTEAWVAVICALIIPGTVAITLAIVSIVGKIKRKPTKDNTNILDHYISTDTNNNYIYVKKLQLLTNYEISIFTRINKILQGTKYVVYPQINLATIVAKNDNNWYQSELFRNIDFGIFNKKTTEPIVMIELNDKTHNRPDRIQRDMKVQNILEQARIPLITLHSDCPNDETQIYKELQKYIEI